MGSPSQGNVVPPELLALIRSGQYRPVNHGAGTGQLVSADGTPLVEFRADDGLTRVTDRYDYAEGTGQYYLPQSVLRDPRYADFAKTSGLNAAMQYQEADDSFKSFITEPGALAVLGIGAGAGLLGGAGAAGAEAAAPFSEMAAAESALASGGSAAAGGTAAALEGAGNMDWLTELLQQTGEAGIDPAALEGGFNAAASSAPWYSSLPTWAQNLAQGSIPGVGGSASGGGTALGNILTPGGGIGGGNGGLPDWISKLIPGAVDAFGNYQQSQLLRDLAEKSRADREPFRQASLGYLNDPSSYATGPGAAMLDANLRRLSVGGNPVGDTAKLGIATQAGLQDWRNAVFGLGELGLGGERTQAELGASAAASTGNLFRSGATGLENILNPPQTFNQSSLQDLLKGFKFGSLGNGTFALT